MFHIALWQPEIPPNTGNVARLCAATGATLHLIGKPGFRLDERSLRRAGLDYWDDVVLREHDALEAFEDWLRSERLRLCCFSARAAKLYTQVAYQPGDVLLFGGESHGLPDSVLARHADRTLCIPQPAGKVRSLNLATAVGIALYEALRQCHGW
jgi:tRNA (cytidine/uridine-2'-O-)-methyltransferase